MTEIKNLKSVPHENIPIVFYIASFCFNLSKLIFHLLTNNKC